MNFLIKISSIFLTLLFVVTINFKSVITASYFVNQTEIIELFCINKEKPQLNCDGKCHLVTQLTEVETDTKETPFPPNTVESNLEINSSLLDNKLSIQPKSSKLFNQRHFNYTPSTSEGYNSTLHLPPKG